MAWAVWLAIPVLIPAAVCVAVWWQGRQSRPGRSPDAEAAMRRHANYLAALVEPARGSRRTPPAVVDD